MRFKTHLVIALAIALALIEQVSYKFFFVPILLITSLLPDIDSSNSLIGHKWYFRPLQFFVKHRGFLHSFSFCIFISIIFALFLPVVALPFFLGYGSHLLLDSFSVDGVQPYWPLKIRLQGRLKTGGRVEDALFISFVIIDVILFILLFL